MIDKTIRNTPSGTHAYLTAARALYRSGRADEVQPYLDHVIRLAAGDPARLSDAYVPAAEIALARGDDDRAYDLARRAMVARPASPAPHATLASIGALTGKL